MTNVFENTDTLSSLHHYPPPKAGTVCLMFITNEYLKDCRRKMALLLASLCISGPAGSLHGNCATSTHLHQKITLTPELTLPSRMPPYEDAYVSDHTLKNAKRIK